MSAHDAPPPKGGSSLERSFRPLTRTRYVMLVLSSGPSVAFALPSGNSSDTLTSFRFALLAAGSWMLCQAEHAPTVSRKAVFSSRAVTRHTWARWVMPGTSL